MSKVGNVTFGLTAQVRSLYSWTWSVTGRYAAAIKIVGRRPNGPSQPGFFYPTNLVGVGHAPPDQFPPRKLSRAAGGKWIKCKVHRLIVRAPVSTGPASDLCSFLNIFYPPSSGFLTRPRSCLYHHDSWLGIFYHIAIPCTFDSVESLYIVERHDCTIRFVETVKIVKLNFVKIIFIIITIIAIEWLIEKKKVKPTGSKRLLTPEYSCVAFGCAKTYM